MNSEPLGAQIHRSADAALERRGLRGLEHIRARDHIRRQNVERQIPAVIVGGEDAIIQCNDVVLRAQPANSDVHAFAAGGARNGNAGDMAQRVGDIVIGKASEFRGVDGVEYHRGVLLDVQGFRQAFNDAGDHNFLQLRLFAGPGRIAWHIAIGTRCAGAPQYGDEARRDHHVEFGHCHPTPCRSLRTRCGLRFERKRTVEFA